MKKSKLLISAFAAMAMFFGLASCKNESDDVDVDVYTKTETENLYYYDVSGTYNGYTLNVGPADAYVTWTTDAKQNTNATSYYISITGSYYVGSSNYSSTSTETMEKSFTIQKVIKPSFVSNFLI